MKNASLLFLCLLVGTTLSAQLSINVFGVSPTITFDENMTDVMNGPFEGNGFRDEPLQGELDSDTWATSGFAQNADFGSQCTTGDCARGESQGGVEIGGIYAFIIDEGNAEDRFLGVQPRQFDFTPGTITMEVKNNTGSPITEIRLSFRRYVNNDENRANSFNVQLSTAGTPNFTDVPVFNYTSPEAADAQGFVFQDLSAVVPLPNTVPTGTSFTVRWTGNDVSGTGERDEFGIDNITVEATEVTALPVALTYFEAQLRDNVVALDWETAFEENNEYFAVERSFDGQQFETIGKVNGAGDAAVAMRYEFIDEAPQVGLNYYRIRQVDFDGTETMYNTQVVRVGATLANNDIKIAPNRTQGQFNILTSSALDGDITYSLYDMSGQLIRTETYDASNTAKSVDLANMSSGMYVLQLETNLGRRIERVVKF